MGASLSNTGHTDFTTTLPHSPSDTDVLWAEGPHQDFRVCQNVVQSTLEYMVTTDSRFVATVCSYKMLSSAHSLPISSFCSYVMQL